MSFIIEHISHLQLRNSPLRVKNCENLMLIFYINLEKLPAANENF